ncbi:protein amnionless isoform X2 [Microcaecilia unicolor]|uniref:Protein amnionless n=1 Tax=Microcaecilia unicolor TaxID=1415580 RepID=A0A6P7YYZ2_9AMPH|nr:protein amnionless isoform X2 [Microcaecilia unicolor]
MNPTVYLLFLLLINVAGAVYKQWIPNTNFENASNWDKNRVPCPGDTIIFENSKKLSVFVQSTHRTAGMYIPWDGEFILASGAGFAAYSTHSSSDPGCEIGSTTTFRDADSYQWLDPELWHAASSTDDLESGNYLFSVHEERVPCQYDDVIFPAGNSFRVNIQPSDQMIELKSISVMGQKFTRDADFARYMQSNTAKLQFHGQGSPKVTNTKCNDKTGCTCGNSGEHENICSALLQHSENVCPGVVCMHPLRPVGHCCDICGAIVSLQYSSDFEIEKYRNRLIFTFLSLAKYTGVQIAISKVYKPQSTLRIILQESVPEIQVVIIDNKTGSETGASAEQLASEIMTDVTNHGQSFGIVRGTMQIATGSNSSQSSGRKTVIDVTASVFGVLCLLLVGTIIFLLKTRTTSFPRFWKRNCDLEPFGTTFDKGFDNPMFDTPEYTPADVPGLYSGEDALKGGIVKESGIYFINPLYDEDECNG